MARTSLTATALGIDNVISNLTNLLTTGGNANAVVPGTGAGNGIQFTNIPTQTFLAFSLGATACTATVNAGMAGVGGLTATTYTITVPVSAISVISGFHSIMNQPGILPGTITIDFSSNTGLVVALFSAPLVY